MSFPEDLPRSELSDVQQRRLQSLVRGLSGNPFWKTRLAEAGWEDLAELGDRLDDLSLLAELPTCGKEELVTDQDRNQPYGSNLSEPLERYTRLHQTSGTTGRPLRWLDTSAAWLNLLEAWSQIFRVAGVVDVWLVEHVPRFSVVRREKGFQPPAFLAVEHAPPANDAQVRVAR